MIVLQTVHKWYRTDHGAKHVLRGLNLVVRPSQRLGIVGMNGAGKSTLIRIISGAEPPSAGRVMHSMTLSWPIGFGGCFHGALSGYDNLRFVCRLYRKDFNQCVRRLRDFSELGNDLSNQVRTYSSGMYSKFSFAMSVAIDFDCLLIDETLAVGDSRFRQKCHDYLFNEKPDRGYIFVSHEPALVAEYCESVLELRDGQLHDH